MKKLKHAIKIWIANGVRLCEEAYLIEENKKTKQELKSLGKGVRFNGRIIIYNPENVEISDNFHIGKNSHLAAQGGIDIGENTHIGPNFTVYTANHCYRGERLPYDETLILKPVIIGRNVWIGSHVLIIPGITIGDGAIVGAGCVVTKDVPDLAIVGNQPLRILKNRDKEHYFLLDSQKRYGGWRGNKLLELGTLESRSNLG